MCSFIIIIAKIILVYSPCPSKIIIFRTIIIYYKALKYTAMNHNTNNDNPNDDDRDDDSEICFKKIKV
jgi:hypothetical protein